jgi:hypothetical protein
MTHMTMTTEQAAADRDQECTSGPSCCQFCRADDTILIQKPDGVLRCEDTAACLAASEHGTKAL